MMKPRTINVGRDFSPVLKNDFPGENPGKGAQFREKYLGHFVINNHWQPQAKPVTFDFSDVQLLAPSFAAEAFAFFREYAETADILKKILFVNTNPIDMAIVEFELDK